MLVVVPDRPTPHPGAGNPFERENYLSHFKLQDFKISNAQIHLVSNSSFSASSFPELALTSSLI